MDRDTYDLITRICKRVLARKLRSRHLEDMIQEVALKYFVNGGGNIVWFCLDYLRENGLSKRGKVCAITIERSVFIGISKMSDDECGAGIIDQFHHVDSTENLMDDVILIPIDREIGISNFLDALNLNSEVKEWVMNNLSLNQKIKFVA